MKLKEELFVKGFVTGLVATLILTGLLLVYLIPDVQVRAREIFWGQKGQKLETLPCSVLEN